MDLGTQFRFETELGENVITVCVVEALVDGELGYIQQRGKGINSSRWVWFGFSICLSVSVCLSVSLSLA